MAFPDYQRDLLAEPFDARYVLDRYFHCGTSHVFAGASPEAEPTFKRELARRIREALGIELHTLELIICGSAHLGFSPVPSEKFGRPFDWLRSDIDVAVVSPELFDRWWAELQQNPLDRETRSRIADDLFWGFINPANAHTVSAMGRAWWDAFRDLKPARENARVRGRVYRTFWSMQNYHTLAIKGGRRKLQDERTQRRP